MQTTERDRATEKGGASPEGAAAGIDRPSVGAAGGGAAETPAPGVGDDDRLSRLALALSLAPFVVSAVALVVGVGGRYIPVADHALIEMHVRDVGGRHTPLIGLYSRGEWGHPGPILFYVLAPFFRLAGSRGIGLNLGALVINGGSLVGMALIARRRGGVPLMLLTLLGSTLLLRTLGADFARDPWNCFVTALPFALLFFLVWCLWSGEAWALPVGAGVTTFLAQTHVGFVLLAVPLYAWGALGLLLATRRAVAARPAGTGGPSRGAGGGDGDGAAGAAGEAKGSAGAGPVRRLVRAVAITAAVLGVLWLPPLIDVVRHTPSNLRLIADWFSGDGGAAHTMAQGWRVMSAQFAAAPEWLLVKKPFSPLTGESPYMFSAPRPLLLIPVAAAAVVLWRRGWEGRAYVTSLALLFALGVVAVARTVGNAFDYRLRWTFVPGLVGLILVAWAAWLLAARRWPAIERRLVPVTLAALVVVCAVNMFTAATAGSPQSGDSGAMGTLLPEVRKGLPKTDGQILVDDTYSTGAWYARSLINELERDGYDVRVPPDRAAVYGRQRMVDPSRATVRLIITSDDGIASVTKNPHARVIAMWSAVPGAERDELAAERQAILDDVAAGKIPLPLQPAKLAPIERALRDHGNAEAFQVAVFIDDSFRGGANPAPAAPKPPPTTTGANGKAP